MGSTRFPKKCAVQTSMPQHLFAATYLKRLATETALPVASPSSNGGATAEMVSVVVGEVTPVRYDACRQEASGQERNCAHLRALSW
jgi:putative transposase